MDEQHLHSIRKLILLMLANKGSGHIGGALGALESIVAALDYIDYDTNWFQKSKNLSHDERLVDAINMRKNRNKFILSNGHICPALYAIWAEKGLFDEYIDAIWQTKDFDTKLNSLEEKWVDSLDTIGKSWFEQNKKRLVYLATFRELESDLEGHPSLSHNPYLVDASTGPLGQGAGVSVGYAHADKMSQNTHKTIVSVGDGECQEGQIWEAAMVASKLKLDNLVWIVDRNYIQIDGDTEEVGGLDNSTIEQDNMSGLAHKFKSFGWIAMENEQGNDIESVKTSLAHLMQLQTNHSLPAILINKTQVGYPYDLFNDYHWHGKTPTKAEVLQVLSEKD
jgi:transketolase